MVEKTRGDKSVQVIIVITDDQNEDGKIRFSIFEKPQSHELYTDVEHSPAVQIGSILSAFLKTIEEHGQLISIYPTIEEVKSKYPSSDYRDKLLTEGNVIHVDLRKTKPKGNA
jgi:hypothetical protein